MAKGRTGDRINATMAQFDKINRQYPNTRKRKILTLAEQIQRADNLVAKRKREDIKRREDLKRKEETPRFSNNWYRY